jgi:transcriptional regulator with XRE-family HTH domain
MQLHEVVLEGRKRKGLTQEELAGLTGITVRTIQRIESGETTPRAYTLKAIAGALELPLSALQPEAGAPVPGKTIPLHTAIDPDEDSHALQLMIFSCFSFLVVPLVHVLVPLYLFRRVKDQLPQPARAFGRSLLRGQLLWTVSLQLLLLATLVYNFWQAGRNRGLVLSYLAPVLAMYALNTGLLALAFFRLRRLPVIINDHT